VHSQLRLGASGTARSRVYCCSFLRRFAAALSPGCEGCPYSDPFHSRGHVGDALCSPREQRRRLTKSKDELPPPKLATLGKRGVAAI
jgi:hypothetical protein